MRSTEICCCSGRLRFGGVAKCGESASEVTFVASPRVAMASNWLALAWLVLLN